MRLAAAPSLAPPVMRTSKTLSASSAAVDDITCRTLWRRAASLNRGRQAESSCALACVRDSLQRRLRACLDAGHAGYLSWQVHLAEAITSDVQQHMNSP